MFHQVALGQGQDVIAHNWLDIGHKDGHWVMLQNIHLMPSFLLELEKKLDVFAQDGSNAGFRLFLTSDPSKQIPIGLLERCIKLTNEPPEGLKANMKRAYAFFTKEEIDEKEPKIKTILFALCYFHSVMLERKKFGPKGWNMKYPFAMGDLRDSSIVLNNYLDGASGGGKVPWDDLKYQCPVYMTVARGATYVFTAQLKTKFNPDKWVLAGVALIMDVEGVTDAYAPGKETPLS